MSQQNVRQGQQDAQQNQWQPLAMGTDAPAGPLTARRRYGLLKPDILGG